MISRRRTGIAVSALTAMLLLAGCTSSPAQTEPSTQAAFLWAVNAETGKLDGVGADTGEEQLTLTLVNVRDHATQFADRPFRDAFVISTADLAARWSSWFAAGPPNAVLSFSVAGDPMPHSIVLRLDPPTYDEVGNALVFSAVHQHRQPDLHPDALQTVAPVGTAAPSRFTSASLFIDSATDAGPQPAAAQNGTVGGGAAAAKVVNGCRIGPGAQCPGADLRGANLSDADLSGANLDGADLSGAILDRTHLEGASLRSARLSGAKLHSYLSKADLRDANLAGANLFFANARSADFSGANLEKARLENATLTQADLSHSNLRGANLRDALLNPAKLIGADLTNADLSWAILSGADLTGADLTGANFDQAVGRP